MAEPVSSPPDHHPNDPLIRLTTGHDVAPQKHSILLYGRPMSGKTLLSLISAIKQAQYRRDMYPGICERTSVLLILFEQNMSEQFYLDVLGRLTSRYDVDVHVIPPTVTSSLGITTFLGGLQALMKNVGNIEDMLNKGVDVERIAVATGLSRYKLFKELGEPGRMLIASAPCIASVVVDSFSQMLTKVEMDMTSTRETPISVNVAKSRHAKYLGDVMTMWKDATGAVVYLIAHGTFDFTRRDEHPLLAERPGGSSSIFYYVEASVRVGKLEYDMSEIDIFSLLTDVRRPDEAKLRVAERLIEMYGFESPEEVAERMLNLHSLFLARHREARPNDERLYTYMIVDVLEDTLEPVEVARFKSDLREHMKRDITDVVSAIFKQKKRIEGRKARRS